MYVPPLFEVTDRRWAIELIERHPFGMLITADAQYPRVSHLPLIAQERGEELWIVGHVARANPHAQSIRDGVPATIVCEGPHAYISAAWYEAPYETVPTWNYTAVHANGRLAEFDAWTAVKILSERMERGKSDPWEPSRLRAEYRESQLRGIVAFELRAEKMYAKAKLSQNRTLTDRLRVIENLESSENQIDRECAAEMARTIRDAE
ncbi:MAG TPA: FMN-binding negative transcriptional regulator [Candidatus Cybelea sp.]